MVKHFLDSTDDDWLLMLDADERISSDTFKLLCDTAHSIDRPVVSGLYFAALWEDLNLRPVPVIFHATEDKGIQPIDDYPKDSIIKIDGAGTGCLLMHRSALKKIRDASPEDHRDWCWFQDGPIGGNKWLSEDLTFCSRLKDNDIPMYAHTGAILQHSKRMWLDSPHHDAWLRDNPAGTGLEQLQ